MSRASEKIKTPGSSSSGKIISQARSKLAERPCRVLASLMGTPIRAGPSVSTNSAHSLRGTGIATPVRSCKSSPAGAELSQTPASAAKAMTVAADCFWRLGSLGKPTPLFSFL